MATENEVAPALGPELAIEPLLEPIPGTNPAGEWLRYESTYDRVLQARKEDDETLPQGVWQTTAKRADWAEVASLCTEALAHRSKDLQLGAYLTEAWMHRHGPGGAAAGIRLMAELCRRFWDSIYPLLDGDDTSFRLAPFEWLDQKLPVHLRMLPLSGSPREGQRPYTFADWERALRRGAPRGEGESDSQESGEAAPTQEKIGLALGRTPAAALLGTVGQLEELLAAAQQAAAAVDALTGHDIAALLHVRQMLEQILGFLKPWSDKARRTTGTHGEAATGAVRGGEAGGTSERPAVPPSAPRAARPAAAPAEPIAAGTRLDGVIQSRAEAYLLLDEVAEYLLRTEPHSPTGYLLKRAVRWGELPLTQLLTELVPDGGNLAEIYRLLGITGSGSRNKSQRDRGRDEEEDL